MRARLFSRVTAVSWIPSEAVSGPTGKAAFATLGHYDDPPPERIDGADTAEQGRTLDGWRAADRFRFANQLGCWVEVADRRIIGAGYDGVSRMGSTRLAAGDHGVTFEAMAMPLIQSEPEVSSDGASARFVQTWGGRTGVPAPRRVNRPPFVQLRAPLAWSTLALTIHVDGRVEHELAGASRFPRHWVYGSDGELVAKSGSTDYKQWYRRAFGRHTPWGDTDTEAFVAAAESALERQLSTTIMRGDTRPSIRKLGAGTKLTEEGATVDPERAELYLVLDGMLRVEVGGEPVAEIGPGAVIGERALLEGGVRTSTLVAITPCRLAAASADQIDRDELEQLSTGHRRETTPGR